MRRWITALSLAWGVCARAAEPADAFWSAHVEPVLREHCIRCHSGDKPKAALDLSSPATTLQGGDSGPALVPGAPDRSRLLQLVLPGADPQMPPKGPPLKADEIEAIRTWIQRLGTQAPAAAAPAGPPKRSPITWRPKPNTDPSEAIDHFIELGWKERGVKASPPSDDAPFARRVHLDLIGRIPTEQELQSFTASRGRDRRARLVDSLLASPEHAPHLATLWDAVLMGRTSPAAMDRRRDQGWIAYLEDAVRRNRPWDAVLRELIIARPADAASRGSVWFLHERNNNPQAMAEAVAPLVFGVQIRCAQCHDHMVAREIKQAHYWGMVAAFNRSKNVSTPAGPAIAESAIGGFVTFANLRKESQQARLLFFNGRSVEETWPAENSKESDDSALYLVPPPADKQPAQSAAVPRFSRRTALAEAVTRDNPLLARATVNRIWALLLGRGLVHPVDLMDSKHPPSHPELLDWLAADFAAQGHDIRRLVRQIVLTRVYALDSRPARQPRGHPATPQPDAFAHAASRPLSAEQLDRSLRVAVGLPPAPLQRDDLHRSLLKEFPDLFAPEYNATLQQAMFLSNATVFDRLISAERAPLLPKLVALPKPGESITAAFRAVYGRKPDPTELAEAARYLATRPGEAGLRQLLWALLTSAEFQLNH